MTNDEPSMDDLGIKIGSKKQAWLVKVRNALSEEKMNCDFTSDLNAEFLSILERKIAEEEEKFK